MIIHYEIATREKFEIAEGTHRSNSLIILLDGEFDYTVKNEKKRIARLSPLIFKNGVTFKKTVIHPIKYIIIRFSQLPENASIFLKYNESDRSRLEDSIFRLNKAILNDEELYIIEHFVNDILFIAQSSQKAQKDSVMTVAQYISEHYDERLSLDFLAEKAGYSKQTLINKFRKQYNKTPIEYLTMVRINNAKLLLVNTHLSIGEISKLCGYENMYYFSNTFKKQTDMSPLKFRQKSII